MKSLLKFTSIFTGKKNMLRIIMADNFPFFG